MKNDTTMRRAPRVRPVSVAIAVLVTTGMVLLGVSAPAFAYTPVEVAMKLTNKAGTPLTGYDVYPIDVANGAELPFDSPVQASSEAPGIQPGIYSMDLKLGDTYTLAMYPGGAALNTASLQFLGGSATLDDAQTFTPTAANNFVEASIATGGTIAGKVTGPTGVGLKDAEVTAYPFDGSNWIDTTGTESSSTGSFEFLNAVPGSVKFEFYAPGDMYPPIYSGGAAKVAGATSSYVSIGATSTVNQRMAVGTGSITGTAFVNIPDEGTFPDAKLIAVAIPISAESGGIPTALDIGDEVASAPASATGAWDVKNLNPGAYVIQTFPYYYQESPHS